MASRESIQHELSLLQASFTNFTKSQGMPNLNQPENTSDPTTNLVGGVPQQLHPEAPKLQIEKMNRLADTVNNLQTTLGNAQSRQTKQELDTGFKIQKLENAKPDPENSGNQKKQAEKKEDFSHKIDTREQEYLTQLYQQIERGVFPHHSDLKNIIQRSIHEQVDKPLSEKNSIEKRLDVLFLEYLPKEWVTFEVKQLDNNDSMNVNLGQQLHYDGPDLGIDPNQHFNPVEDREPS